jgi:tetratricopeptide (TPR) repeat protein
LAYAYSEEHRHSWNARPESYDSLERALEVAEIAIKLDPANQVAHGALALTHFQLKEYDRFRAEADRAVALNPNNALWLAYFGLRFCDLESWDRGLPLVRKALALNPNPPPWLHNPFFFYHYRHGRYEAALTEVQKIKTEDFRTPMFRAATYGQLGRLEEAERELSAVKQMWPGFPEGLRREMIDQYGYPPARFDHLLEGLRKAGMQDSFD